MTNLEYYITHVFPTGWNTISAAFRIWCDLMTSNYKDYVLLKDDNPEQECIDWFWATLGEDDVYEKDFLEYLYQLADDVETGKEKAVPFTQDMFDRLNDLVGDLIDDLNTEEELEEE
jgi:hypothetical protein